MSSKSPLLASAEQRDSLKRLAVSAKRADADRARAILVSLSGWKSVAIGEVPRPLWLTAKFRKMPNRDGQSHSA
jgi:hypothetical protein